MKLKIFSWLGVLLLTLTLAGCAMGPDMPMEITVDGCDVKLGRTTMQDLIDEGYGVNFESRQDVAKDGDKYISFSYSVDKGAGRQFWVTVSVPWSGNTDISNETSLSATEGVVQSVHVRQSAAEDMTVSYNGVSLADMNFDTAADWGAKEDKEQSVKTYKLTAKQGFLKWESKSTSDETFHELLIQMNKGEFEKMQK